MAKSTRASGATFTPEELADPVPPVVVQRAMLGGEPPSVGTDGKDSLESSETELMPSDQQTQDPLKPAPTTDNPSSPEEAKEEQEPGSTVRTAGTSTRKTGQASRRTSAKSRAGTRTTDESDFDEFD